MEEKDNDLVEQMMLEEVITNAVQIPGGQRNKITTPSLKVSLFNI